MSPTLFNRKLSIGFLFTVILLLVVTSVGLNVTRQLEEASDWVNHTYDVIRTTRRVSEYYQKAESNHLLYISTSNPYNLQAFKSDSAAIKKDISGLIYLVSDNPRQLKSIAAFKNCIDERISEESNCNLEFYKQGISIVPSLMMRMNNENELDCVKDSLVSNIINAEKKLLVYRKEKVNNRVLYAVIIILTGCLCGISFLFGMYLLIKRTFKEKRLVRENLQISESKFSKAYNDSASGMAMVSIKNGQWLDINDQLSEILGYSKEELCRTTFMGITHPEDVERNMLFLKKAASGELTKFQLEKRFIHKDGTIIWALVNVSIINDIEGIEPFSVTQIIDISDIKKLVAEMEVKNNTLSQTSEELKIKINQLEDFNSIVAHNLRGPAATIQYILQLMLNSESEREKHEYMDMLIEISKSLNGTLDDLMIVLEIKLNNKIVFDYCELKEITNKISLEMAGEILKSKATIETNFEVDVINFPKVYQESIFYNMISNSLKYRQRGTPPAIKISSFMHAEKTKLVFEDNGLGIDLERHGENMFKLNKVFHSGYDSKGVGLFITKNQIETHGGSINVDSQPNQGTRFTVSL